MSKIIIECADQLGLILFKKLFLSSLDDLNISENKICLDYYRLQLKAELALNWITDDIMPVDMVLSYGLHKYDLIITPFKISKQIEDKIECGDVISIYTWMPTRYINFPF